jgi:hypothetical protein
MYRNAQGQFIWGHTTPGCKGEIMKRNISHMDLASEALFKKRDGAKRLNTDIYWATLLHISSDLSDILNAENLGRDVKKIIKEIRKKYIADYEE